MKSINLLPVFASFLVISLTYCQPKEEPKVETPEVVVEDAAALVPEYCLPESLILGSSSLTSPPRNPFTVSTVYIDPTKKLAIESALIVPIEKPDGSMRYEWQFNLRTSGDSNFDNKGYLMCSAILDIGIQEPETTLFEVVLNINGEEKGRKKRGLMAHETTGHDKELGN